jgi:hypothetical protein
MPIEIFFYEKLESRRGSDPELEEWNGIVEKGSWLLFHFVVRVGISGILLQRTKERESILVLKLSRVSGGLVGDNTI